MIEKMLEKIAYTLPNTAIPLQDVQAATPGSYGTIATPLSPDQSHFLTNQQGLFGNYASYEKMPELNMTYRINPLTGQAIATPSQFLDPHLLNAVGGTGVGALLGAGLGAMGAKPVDKKRNATIGGIGGAALGGAAGAVSPDVSHIKDSLINSFGQNHMATNAVLGSGLGLGLGELYNRYSKETDAGKQNRNRAIGSLLGGVGLGAMGATY